MSNTPATIATPPGWEGILDAGEAIVWQGRPDGRFRFGWRDLVTGLFGFIFAGFALVWMAIAASAGGFFWAFGLIHFSVGAAIAVGGPVWRTYRLRHTWYTLTTRRAFIATDTLTSGRSLAAYPIAADTVLTLEGEDPASVHFASVMRRINKRDRLVPIGFEHIHDAGEVLEKLREIQKAAR
ncbi:aspartate carbamoyltransferase catalytic subunit [Phaeovulum sp.]|uniref:aspartate carbamoyltransferase catalytic subunit n=1 Tax=Phaeovulum sp. TaxID=2934796 RepID=UPI0027308D07|nr:aspartate carbamoyltransferase catalytic subunit [Phaeovulum sp.]MDP1669294.1 aspartate carbamoyltransferase catalytic subunit [Phaeovulum sp.]MDZ4119570.1 aspartate carbamoyltransferase catalytic subunit [Phaeovulum sp.]